MKDVLGKPVAAIVQPFDLRTSLAEAVCGACREREPAILESSLSTTPFSRYSVFAADPVISVEIPAGAPRPFNELRQRLQPWVGHLPSQENIPFAGGWIGFLSYQLGAAAEPRLFRHQSELSLPLARFGFYDTAAVFDHLESRWHGVALEWQHPRTRPSARRRLQAVGSFLRAAAEATVRNEREPVSTPATTGISRGESLRRIAKAKCYIRAGDVYQVNLTQRFDSQTDAPPEALVNRLRRFSPSGHAALLKWGDTAIISSSPELFLRLRDGAVTTRPIKGTRPRASHAMLDGHHRRQLMRSAKDRAELTMIVDLLRNDLGRVCEFGSVRVENEGAIEEHPTVFHRTATISGRMRADSDWADLLTATFPSGSVTGAPKIRAMQIIEELEPTPRDVYCGSIGYIGADGAMQFNVAIRTMVQRGHDVRLHAGSGIVADSVPELEYDETLTKLRGMLLALNTNVADASAVRFPEAAIA